MTAAAAGLAGAAWLTLTIHEDVSGLKRKENFMFYSQKQQQDDDPSYSHTYEGFEGWKTLKEKRRNV